MKQPTDTSKSSDLNPPVRYYREEKKKAKKLKPIVHEITNRDRDLMEMQRQRMVQRDIVERSRNALDEDSQLCQQFYASVGSRRDLLIDVDTMIDLL